MPTCTIHPLPYRADPGEYFATIRHAPGAVLLDSARPIAQRGRFDLMSAWPLQALPVADHEAGTAYFQRLRQALADLGQAQLPDDCPLPFAGGLIGYLSYDFGRRLEPLPAGNADDLGLADAWLGVYGWALINDHHEHSSQLVLHPALPVAESQRLQRLFSQPRPQDATPPLRLLADWHADTSPQSYQHAFSAIEAYLQAGDCYQVNFSQRWRAPCSGDPWTAYQALRGACPTPFSGYLAVPGGGHLLSFSPERFIQVNQRRVETRPIKGTRPRASDPAEDANQARDLLTSAKDRAENLMIVDLLRNDMGRSCQVGSVHVPELFVLESYPNVHHLVSSVVGELAADKDCLDLLAGSFPGGSITGAPKIRAMQIIDELECSRRAFYCGSLLYLDVRGRMDSSIAIRSLLVKDGQVSCWGGGAIVADSSGDAEYAESLFKVQVLLDTLRSL